MERIFYNTMDIPVIAEAGVLVVGAGPGGLGAAVMAARSGADTLLVERYGIPGGTPTLGEITPFMPNHVQGRLLDRPVCVEWARRMSEYRSVKERQMWPWNEDSAVDHIDKNDAALAMEDLLLEAGVRLLYHHTLVDVIKNDDKIEAAVFHSKSGFCAIRAKVFIDSTGDGDLAALAGAVVEVGNEEGFCQPMTTCFKLSGVDYSRMPSRKEINDIFNTARQNGEVHCCRENVLFFSTLEDDVVHFNTTRVIQKSAISGVELSEAELEGRKQLREFVRMLVEKVPGFENARIRSIAHHIGVRESRRIRGKVYQTLEDFKNQAKFPDGIARCNYCVDIHNPSGTGTTIINMPAGEYYEIRYGTLIPEGSANLLMGCRAISVEHALHSSTRVIAPVCSVGQAAGVAAALCVQRGCRPEDLDGAEVRKYLKEAGAWL